MVMLYLRNNSNWEQAGDLSTHKIDKKIIVYISKCKNIV